MKPKSKRVPRRGKKLLWIIDAWGTLDHTNETTLRLAEEAIALGSECFLAETRSISLIQGKPCAWIQKITRIERPRVSENIFRSEGSWLPIEGFDAVFFRTDPPIDLAYLLPLQILAQTERKRSGRSPKPRMQIHSPPDVLFRMNEKWSPSVLGNGLFPESLVSASVDRLITFAKERDRSVLKPLYQAQSKGVRILDRPTSPSQEKNLRSILEESTEGGKIPVILQAYLAGITRGETRLWYVQGKLLSVVKKLPKTGESIINMDHGGTIAKTRLKANEAKAALTIGRLLKKEGILWAAIDLIDGKVTDFNFTSPGLLVAMEDLLGENLAKKALLPVLK